MAWIGFVIIVVAFIAWIVWEQQPETVVLTNGSFMKKYKGKKDSIEISKLVEIKYHYHAVAGFIGTWEFIDKDGRSLAVDGNAIGISEALSRLEKLLPDFSLVSFQKQFDAGEVVDTLDVWRNT